MSRSYKKYVKVGTCGGFGSGNTEFYKNRRRKTSNKNNHILRNAVAHYDGDEIDEHIYEYKPPKRDDWAEPTDGTSLYDRKRAVSVIDSAGKFYNDGYKEWVKRKILSKLKRKMNGK